MRMFTTAEEENRKLKTLGVIVPPLAKDNITVDKKEISSKPEKKSALKNKERK